jgi:hypothetical protein
MMLYFWGVIIVDRYYEQLTPAYKSKFYSASRYLIWIMIIIFAISIIPFFPLSIAAVVLGIVFFFAKRRGSVEYEYIFIGGEITIDIIREALRRKKVIKFNMNDVELIAPDGSTYSNNISKGKKIIAYTKNSTEKIYVAVLRKEGAVSEVYFAPNEDFINMCFRSNPKNVKRKEV